MKWIKPNGNEIETNDEKATIEYCKSLDWKESKGSAAKTAKPAAKADKAKGSK